MHRLALLLLCLLPGLAALDARPRATFPPLGWCRFGLASEGAFDFQERRLIAFTVENLFAEEGVVADEPISGLVRKDGPLQAKVYCPAWGEETLFGRVLLSSSRFEIRFNGRDGNGYPQLRPLLEKLADRLARLFPGRTLDLGTWEWKWQGPSAQWLRRHEGELLP